MQWSRHGDIVWAKDGSGFYYSRYPEPRRASSTSRRPLNQMIYFHKLGDAAGGRHSWSTATRSIPSGASASAQTDDDKYLVLSIYRSTDPQNQVLVRDASTPADAPWTELVDDFDNEFSFIGNEGAKFYF